MKALLAVFMLGLYSRYAESYFYAIGPNVIRFENDETILVGLLNESNKWIEVWLENQDGDVFSKRSVFVGKEASRQKLTVRVTEEDIFKIDERDLKPKTVKLVAKRDSDVRRIDVLLSYNSGYLVVQTDKPVYTPRQTVKFRVLPMTEDFRPAGTNKYNLSVDIIEAQSGLTFSRENRITDAAFYEGDFDLPPRPKTGIWSVRAFFRGQYETEGRALFAVEEYVLPTFGVTITPNKTYFLPGDEEVLKINVMAQYVYKKPVQGKASLSLYLRDPENIRKSIVEIDKTALSFNGDVDFEITLQKLCDYSDICENFPDGSKLEIEANVFEDATGNNEIALADNIVFSNTKYKFSFERSKTTFRKGMTYYLKVNLVYPNGEFVKGKQVKITRHGLANSTTEKTDDQGQVTAVFNSPSSASIMVFTVECDGEKSEQLTVQAYKGVNQIQVEYVMREEEGYIEAYIHRQSNDSTSILFLLVSRGQVVDSFHEEIATKTTRKLAVEQNDLITSPTVRLLAFFIDKTSNAVVADSYKFTIPVSCRGNGLRITPALTFVNPGAQTKLTIEGSPGMMVGLNVIDKALLLVNNSQEIFGKSKMYDVMDSHDIGCGDGSGDTSESVFKNTGLTLLADASTSSNKLIRDSESCTGKRRRKRDVDECGTVAYCCEDGNDYAFALLNTSQKVDPYSACISLASAMAINGTHPFPCIEAAYETCLDILLQTFYDDDISGKSFGTINKYRTELQKITSQGIAHYVRKHFDESWLFENEELDDEGRREKQLIFPDSITEWMVQAIGINKDQGFCVASPVNITAFRDFFIQLDLPYQVTRMEHVNIKATLFYYGKKSGKDIQASVYLDYNPDYCSNSQPNERQRIPLNLIPNSAQTVRFPIIPIKAGRFDVIVTAMVSDAGVSRLDTIKKYLYVKNEGIEEQENVLVCLDPLKQRNDCQNDPDRVKSISYQTTSTLERKQTIIVDLSLPAKSIVNTGSATGYFSSNVMDGVVSLLLQGVDNILRMPTGCVEQTLSGLAPTVYAMSYLKTTKQITPDIETKGHTYIRDGINRQLAFREPDGSYAGYKRSGSSTWLSAFIAKVYCQAQSTDNAVNIEGHIKATLQWVMTKNNNGKFFEQVPIWGRGMMGQVKEGDPTLTSFVVIALSECKMRDQAVNASIIVATRYLESLSNATLIGHPYLLAISTYALAMTNSRRKWELKDLLMSVSHEKGSGLYWGNPGSYPASADAIETTAYALLATLQFDDIATSSRIVRWLTSQRSAGGSFRSTQDTVVGLQALSAYDIKTFNPNVDLSIELTASMIQQQFKLTKENAQVLKIAEKLPVGTRNNRLVISVEGTGTGRLDIDLRYNRPREDDEKCQLVISDVVTSPVREGVNVQLAEEIGVKCDICGNCENDDNVALGVEDPGVENIGRQSQEAGKRMCVRFSIRAVGEKEHGMSIVNFGLETGVDIDKKSLDKLEEMDVINMYEMPENGKGFIILYLDNIKAEPTKFSLILEQSDDKDIQNKQPASIEVYDYYNPNIKCMKFYSTSPKRSGEVTAQCDGGRRCKCLQNICAKDIKGKLTKMKRPAYSLAEYSCSPETADYAVLVKIVDYGDDGAMRIATGRVSETLKKGEVLFEKGDEMKFQWMKTCKYPDFAMDTEYYIIGLDGYKLIGENGKRDTYVFELMNTAVILKKPRLKNTKFGRIMTNYKKFIKKGCIS